MGWEMSRRAEAVKWPGGDATSGARVQADDHILCLTAVPHQVFLIIEETDAGEQALYGVAPLIDARAQVPGLLLQDGEAVLHARGALAPGLEAAEQRLEFGAALLGLGRLQARGAERRSCG